MPVNLPRKYGLPIPRALTKSRPFNYIKRKLKNEETEEQQQPPTSTNSIENIAWNHYASPNNSAMHNHTSKHSKQF